jgi:mRNA interferase HicA
VKGVEFLRRLKRLARRRGWAFAWHPGLGKGSHGKLFLNGRQTTVCDLKREVATGSLHGMLRQLDISTADFFEE